MCKIINDFINAILISGLTQKQIALASGVHENTINHWVTKRFVPSIDKAVKVAKVIGWEFILLKLEN